MSFLDIWTQGFCSTDSTDVTDCLFMISVNWKRLADFLLAAFQDVDPNVRLQAVKILENYIKGESVAKVDTQPVLTSGPMAGTSPSSTRAANRWIHSVTVSCACYCSCF